MLVERGEMGAGLKFLGGHRLRPRPQSTSCRYSIRSDRRTTANGGDQLNPPRRTVGAAKNSATIKSGRSVQLGRTKESKQNRLSVDLNLSAYQTIHWRAALKGSQ